MADRGHLINRIAELEKTLETIEQICKTNDDKNNEKIIQEISKIYPAYMRQ